VNKKQKILTVVTLVVFIALGALHYLAVKSYPDYSAGKHREDTTWRNVTADEVLDSRVPAGATQRGRYFQVPVKTQVPVPDYRSYWKWSDPKESMLPDVRMPWFMLGVIYTALFFLLQSKRGGS
jgi:hypothetical protein